jgi:hypothetical protein
VACKANGAQPGLKLGLTCPRLLYHLLRMWQG